MLRGRFGNTSGRPFIEGRLLLPRIGIRSDISFLVDTGADRSILLPDDGDRMGIDYTKLRGDQESVGIGGLSHNFVEGAIVIFSEANRFLHVYMIDLAITPSDPDMRDMPSPLGRDILDQWRMTYDATKPYLAFRVLSADITIPLTDE